MDTELRLKPADGVIFQEVAGETVILDMRSEHYFGLDAIGTRFWELMKQGLTLAAISSQLLQEYEVDAAVLDGDLAALVRELLDAGLICEEAV